MVKVMLKVMMEHWLHLLASTLFNQVSIALRRISDQCDADDGWLVGWLRRRRKKKKRKTKKKNHAAVAILAPQFLKIYVHIATSSRSALISDKPRRHLV